MRMFSDRTERVIIGYSKTDMSRKVHRFFQRLNSVQSVILLVEFFTCIEKIRERTT